MVPLDTTRSTVDDPGGGSDAELDVRVGSVVAGKYRIEKLLGRGGMGAVYQATHTAIGKRVALKFLEREVARDHDATARFQREAQAASSVESAHIVQIFDSGTSDDGLPFLVMELLQGEDLRTRLRREGRLEPTEMVHIAGQVLRGLARAHDAQIVHRDLKPDNIFLCFRDDDPLFAKIVDFGISKVFRAPNLDTLTRRGTVLGTAYYMSPEQAQAFRDVDGRADLYSLGAILYEALCGRPPHTGNAYEAVLINICTKDADDVRLHAPNVSEPLARVIAKALSRDRERRYQSAREFYAELAAAVPGVLRAAPAASESTIPSDPLFAHALPPDPARAQTEAAPTPAHDDSTPPTRVVTPTATSLQSTPQPVALPLLRRAPALAAALALVVLGGAAALAFRVAPRVAADRTHEAARSATHAGAALPARAEPIEVTRVEPAASDASLVDLAADGGRAAATRADSLVPRGHKPSAATRRTTTAQPASTGTGRGVASSLELNTRGP